VSRINKTMRDAFVNIDAEMHNPMPAAEAIAFLGRFYLNMARAATPDVFHGLGREQSELNELEATVLAFEGLVRAQRSLTVAEFGGTDGFLAWSREVSA